MRPVGSLRSGLSAVRAALGAVALACSVGLGAACSDGGSGRAPPPLPGDSLYAFFALGDTGRPSLLSALRSGQRAVAWGMEREDARRSVDAVVLLGDNFYPHGLEEATLVRQVREHIVRPYCRFLRLDGPRSAEVRDACPGSALGHGRPLYAVLGNHDYGNATSPTLQRDTLPAFVPSFDLPEEVAALRRLGDGIDLILVDSERLLEGADPAPLRQALRASTGPWRVLALHRPVALANGPQGGPEGGEMRLRETVRRAVADAGVRVHLTLAGHTHNMQVLAEPDPMPLHVVAGSGATTRRVARGDATRRFGRAAVGFARIDRVRGPEGERLIATLFESPRYPAVQAVLGEPAWVIARFSVDPDGGVRDELAGTPAR